MSFLQVTIHVPGRGNNLLTAGMKLMSAKGKANPKPINTKIARVTQAGVPLPKANAAAVPKKGAEHGVAITDATIPFANEAP